MTAMIILFGAFIWHARHLSSKQVQIASPVIGSALSNFISTNYKPIKMSNNQLDVKPICRKIYEEIKMLDNLLSIPICKIYEEIKRPPRRAGTGTWRPTQVQAGGVLATGMEAGPQ
jgi:hypothetical protein